MPRAYTRKESAERFWEKVNVQEEGCWLWTASTSAYGYGSFWDGSRLVRAHRFSWEIHFGPIPQDLQVLHQCDVPRCVRPEHLFLGTQADNVHDAVAKGRMKQPGKNRGEENGRAKITRKDAEDIRQRYADEWISQEKLGKEYGITQAVVSKIIHRDIWN